MTVAELIAKLQEFAPDMEVAVAVSRYECRPVAGNVAAHGMRWTDADELLYADICLGGHPYVIID